jgi:transcriptional regulator with XRE-family HTH domain
VARVLDRLGKRVRALRVVRKLTQAGAAEAAKLDHSHWQAIERARTNPTVATLVGVVRALEVKLPELFKETGEGDDTTTRRGRSSDVVATGRPPRSKPR